MAGVEANTEAPPEVVTAVDHAPQWVISQI